MLQSELIAVVIVVLVILVMSLKTSSRINQVYRADNDDHSNMRHTNIDGVRDSNEALPSPWTYEPPQFMGARFKVLAEDGLGENTEPLDDMVNKRIFKNPAFEKPTHEGYSDTSQTFWNSTKSTPTLHDDDIHLLHSSAEMQTPDFRVRMSGKSRHFLPHTGGRSRLVFSSFENSNSEPKFRQ